VTAGEDHWTESARRIAWHCARTTPVLNPAFPPADRYEAALDGIIAYAARYGWPEDSLKPVFRAGSNAIGHENDERTKHLPHGIAWLPVPGQRDQLAEDVTDRVGIWQLCQLFTDTEWAAVWALAEVLKYGGGYREAAALLGLQDGTIAARLWTARGKARANWVAPGDSPVPRYDRHRGRPGTRPRYQRWKYRRKGEG
jgi:hypothetical protein